MSKIINSTQMKRAGKPFGPGPCWPTTSSHSPQSAGRWVAQNVDSERDPFEVPDDHTEDCVVVRWHQKRSFGYDTRQHSDEGCVMKVSVKQIIEVTVVTVAEQATRISALEAMARQTSSSSNWDMQFRAAKVLPRVELKQIFVGSVSPSKPCQMVVIK